MRDFEINEANSRAAFGRFTWVMRLVSNWRMRKDIKRMQKFSNYQLRDIGLSRADLNRLVCLPLDRDLNWEAERRELLQSRYSNLDMPHLAPLKPRGVALPHAEMPAWMTKSGEGLANLHQ